MKNNDIKNEDVLHENYFHCMVKEFISCVLIETVISSATYIKWIMLFSIHKSKKCKSDNETNRALVNNVTFVYENCSESFIIGVAGN